jgi:membrane fusion protein, multidrug efflux system
MPIRSQIFATVVLAILFTGGWLYWSDFISDVHSTGPVRKNSRAVPVLVEPAIPTDDKQVIRAIGTGEARRSATIHAATAGEIVKINFEAGQRVTKGDVLLRLDARHQNIAVRLADVAVKEATRQLKRLQKLAPSGAASMARLETAQANLESADLRLDQARAALRDRSVYAPFNGVIGLTEIDVGDRITVSTPIATLDDRAFIDVVFNLPEEFASRVAIGSLAIVRPRTMAEKELEGSVTSTGSRIDPDTRSLRVKVEIANPDDTLRPGASFEVQLSFVGLSYPSVREVAVLWSRDGAYVWRIDGDRAKKIVVKVIRREAGRILLDGPLKAGDPVVVEGVQGLRTGQRVTPRPYNNTKLNSLMPSTDSGRS